MTQINFFGYFFSSFSTLELDVKSKGSSTQDLCRSKNEGPIGSQDCFPWYKKSRNPDFLDHYLL